MQGLGQAAEDPREMLDPPEADKSAAQGDFGDCPRTKFKNKIGAGSPCTIRCRVYVHSELEKF